MNIRDYPTLHIFKTEIKGTAFVLIFFILHVLYNLF